MELMLQSAQKMGFIDLKGFGGDFYAVRHRYQSILRQPFPRAVLAPYTKIVASLSMQALDD
jgi:hypothetical protein